MWRSARIGGFLLLSLVSAVLLVSAPSAGADDACLAVRQGETVEVSWNDDGGRHVVRRDGSWLATPGLNVSSYVDSNPSADPQYEVRTRLAGVQVSRACSGPGDVDPGTQCVATQGDGQVELSWVDNGGRHVLRRNGSWLATPGSNSSSYIDTSAPAGATYELRARLNGALTIDACDFADDPPPTTTTTTTLPATERQFVIHVSIDGLRADHVTHELMANLSAKAAVGASTLNARTDPASTQTLPNHTSQLTSRFVWGPSGHRITVNEDPGGTVHDQAGAYVASVFDVVHDHGGRTVMYVGKEKFGLHDRTWNDINGAPDVVGPDDGRDKIDVYVKEDPAVAAAPFAADLVAGSGNTFGFFHIRTPDQAGHATNWLSDGYLDGVREADAILAELMDQLDQRGVLNATTFIVTADHGGPLGLGSHANPSSRENYTVPFVVFGPGVGQNVDLYELNVGHRLEPGTLRPNKDGVQPIRGHEAGNLVLDILGLPPIPGSTLNALQDLKTS